MSDKGFRLYGYRWMVLAVFMFINLTIQMLWIAYAPITRPAVRFYGVTDLQIGLLAMSFFGCFCLHPGGHEEPGRIIHAGTGTGGGAPCEKCAGHHANARPGLGSIVC